MAISPVPRIEPLTGFQPWIDSSHDQSVYPAITITQENMHINRLAEVEYGLAPYSYVRLYWDKTLRRIALKFFSKGDFPGARKARHVGTGTWGRRVSCAPFLTSCSVTCEDYGRYPCTDDSGPGLLVIQLRKRPTNWAPLKGVS